jgi:pimeloyl-ACP methyl ester carboxylesterase
VLRAVLAPGEKAVLAGHSMGAMAMVAFGSRYPQELRQRVAAAAIISTGVHELVTRSAIVPMPLPLAKLAQPMSTKLISMSPPGGRVNAPIRALIKYTSLSKGATQAEVDFCARIVSACPPATRAGFGRMISDLDNDAEVRDFDVPATVISGTRDRLTPIWHARRLAATLPALTKFVELEGAGHMTPVQSAADVNAVLRRLIRDYLPASEQTPELVQLPEPGASDHSTHTVDLTRRHDRAQEIA